MIPQKVFFIRLHTYYSWQKEAKVNFKRTMLSCQTSRVLFAIITCDVCNYHVCRLQLSRVTFANDTAVSSTLTLFKEGATNFSGKVAIFVAKYLKTTNKNLAM